MTYGYLNQQLVRSNFWPACQSCKKYEICKTQAAHPAFPHTWHWHREAIQFSDGDLILQSWVGSSVNGEPHTGCYDFSVEPDYLIPLAKHHQQYLTLWQEFKAIDARLRAFEREVYDARVESLYRQHDEISEHMQLLVEQSQNQHSD